MSCYKLANIYKQITTSRIVQQIKLSTGSTDFMRYKKNSISIDSSVMNAYFDLVLQEYDLTKGYDVYEINRCIELLRQHLEVVWGFDDDSNCSTNTEFEEDVSYSEQLNVFIGMDEDEIEQIIEECELMLKEMVSGLDASVKTEHNSSSTVETTDRDVCDPIDTILKRLEPYCGDDLQRTPEWFAKRRQMITASIAHKILKIDMIKGRGIGVIRDKIIPPETASGDTQNSGEYNDDDVKVLNTVNKLIPSNPDSPNVRGNRYEPIIRRIYENLNNVVVKEYSCVDHPLYSFIGASPDGIVVEGDTKGRMVEIKCPQPASIDKDGNTVREEYWCQMQLQMEVCDLPSCDYVRAVVRDAEKLDDLKKMMGELEKQMINGSITKELGVKDSQIMANGTIWMDIDGQYNEESVGEFTHEDVIHETYGDRVVFIRHYVVYYKDWFTVTVSRNKEWFSDKFLPKAKETWEEIQKGLENPEEWAKRFPVKRRKVIKLEDPSVCMIMDD